jgi:hypothetical protein
VVIARLLDLVRAAFALLKLDPSAFDPQFDRTTMRWDARRESRGGFPYRRAPGKWLRFGLRVDHRTYDGPENWLGSDDSPGEWAVAYHGTRPGHVRSIIENPMRPGPRCAYGWGIYCSPDAEVAAHYAPPWTIAGVPLQFVFQARVNTARICQCEDGKSRRLTCITRCKNDEGDATLHITTAPLVWMTGGRNEKYQNIRCYALLVRVP